MYLQDLVSEKGGKAYTKKVKNIHQVCVWSCINNHIFKETLGNVFYKNRWCPDCPVNYGQLLVENILEELIPNHTPEFLRTKTKYKQKMVVITVDYFYKDLKLCVKYNGIDRYGFQDFVEEEKENDELLALDTICDTYKFKLLKIPYSVGYYELRDFMFDELSKLFIPITSKNNLLSNDCLFGIVNAQARNLLALLRDTAKMKRLVLNLSEYPVCHETKIAALCAKGHKLSISPRSIIFMDAPCILCLRNDLST
jgi:hypothetical protein